MNIHQLRLFDNLTQQDLKAHFKIGRPCPTCGRTVKFFWKTLDSRLTKQFQEIADFMWYHNQTQFDPREVWANDPDMYHKVIDHHKLHYWGLIKKAEVGGHWYITQKGKQFLTGSLGLPKRICVYDNQDVTHLVKPVLQLSGDWPSKYDQLVYLENAEKRWQQTRLDYATDYTLGKPL